LDLTIKLAAIAAIGVTAQWIAWRTGWPGIALMLIGGIIAGPVTGFIDPARDFGALYQPAIKLAVAVILFESGLGLNFRQLRHAGWPLASLVLIGVPIAWFLNAGAAHYVAGLPLEVAILFGGILVVTGPTVIGPLLRQLRVGARVRDLLKWEGVVNDPIGALLAVLTLAYISYAGEGGSALREIGLHVALAGLFAIVLGIALAGAIGWAFPRALVPEFLKVPVTFAAVVTGFVIADAVEHETGLLTVTAMGIAMANMRIDSLAEMRRTKESVSILLISGVFIILSATLDWETVTRFEARYLPYLLVILFVVRPLTVLISLLPTKMPWRERLFVAWIAPRGIVCVAITGLFAIRLQELGFEVAPSLVTLAFAIAITTILAHGFTAQKFAEYLGIDQGPGRGILIAGATAWSIELALALKKLEVPVLIVDSGYLALRHARRKGVDTHHGDLLEAVHAEDIDNSGFQAVIAATDNEAYNSLIAAELGPEIGRSAVFQIAAREERPGAALPQQLRGRTLFRSAADLTELLQRHDRGWTFKQTRISDKYRLSDFQARLADEAELLAAVRKNKQVQFFTSAAKPALDSGDSVIAYVPPGGDAAEGAASSTAPAAA
jgi:NhaP-type Na+/H+ or K+/H+ antiporter